MSLLSVCPSQKQRQRQQQHQKSIQNPSIHTSILLQFRLGVLQFATEPICKPIRAIFSTLSYYRSLSLFHSGLQQEA